jgi:twinkle protein
MQLVERALNRFNGVINGDAIDWDAHLSPEDVARIVPAQVLAEQGKKRLLHGSELESGLALPWPKTVGRVLVKNGKLVIWTGWSHHGKTNMLKQVILGAIKSGEKAVIASLEEQLDELWHDLAIMGCGTERPTESNVDSFIQFITDKLFLYDQQGTIDAARAIALIRYAAKELGATQVVIDSLMMLNVDRDNYDAQRKFVADLKAAAKDTGATVHLVAHMRKRDGKTGEDQPGSMHDIAGGHEIASIADYVFNVWRDKAGKGDFAAVLKVEKQRGRINWLGKLGFNFHQESRQFTENNFAMRFW